MTAIWCIAPYYLVNHPLIASRIRHIGHIVLPFVIIGLGITFWLNLLFPFSDNYYVAIDSSKLIPDLRMLSYMSRIDRLKNGKKR